jgi:serine-type D-Ala-D-Ala endopeptidase (penicillin-binding protein 7)
MHDYGWTLISQILGQFTVHRSAPCLAILDLAVKVGEALPLKTGRLAFLLGALGPMLLASGWTQAKIVSASESSAHRHRHHHLIRPSDGGPGLRSEEVLVLDTAHSEVLYARRADVPQPIASITKLLTALVVMDAHQPLDETLEITREDCALGRGAYSRLRVGTRLTRGDMLHLALMASENRAAHALARSYPGGETAFVDAMNAKARSLGMTTAQFVEPTGLSSDNVASPEDLAKLVAAASEVPLISEYSTASNYSVRIGRRKVEFRTTDSLVRNPGWKILVQKTGYISEAGRCLVMRAQIDGRNVVLVLLNSYGKYTRVADARRVRKWMDARLQRTAVRSANTA